MSDMLVERAGIWNIWYMVVTLEVSHVPISWLNALASRNIWAMVVTLEVFHVPEGTDILVERVGVFEHALHGRDARGVPCTDILVERDGT